MSSPRQRRTAIQEEEACHECQQESHRLFICGRCRKQVLICSGCDHGNIYCKECSPIQRLESCRRAGAKYQDTLKGAQKHAERMERYRERRKEKVTHQGYLDGPSEPIDDGKQALNTAEETAVDMAADLEDLGVPELGSEGSQPINEEPITTTTSVPEAVLAFLPPRREVYREYRCDFCGRRCGVYSRLGFIRRR